MAPTPRTAAKFYSAFTAIALVPLLSGCGGAISAEGIPAPNPRAQAIDTATTSSIAVRPVGLSDQSIDVSAPTTQLKAALDAIGRGDLSTARRTRDSLPARSLDRKIVMWAMALSGNDNVTSGEIAQAANELSGWPGATALRRNSERAMYRENPPARTVIDAFGTSRPLTVEGAIVLARAHMASGNAERARQAIAPAWREDRMEAREEALILREFGRVLSRADHRHRMEKMLYHDRIASAERVAGPGGGEALLRAWAAVIRKENNASRLLDAVPRDQRTAGYVYAKSKHLRWNRKYKQAAETMLTAPKDAQSLVDPDAWWIERRVLSRELLDIGDPALAYRIAAAHSAESPVHAADAEFHAGWYALRGTKDARTAARHFARIGEVSSGPISQARAHYWLGRAAEAGAGGDAKAHYQRAAQYGTVYYGQLAASKLGRNTINAEFPRPTDADRRNFERREAVAAIKRLESAGHSQRATLLYRDVADQLTSPGELALLSVMAERENSRMMGLRVGKIAAGRGLDVGALAHPVGAIPDTANISGAGKALAYAIARQESEFNASAVSGAGARGLLQLLPGTAKDMARKTGLPFSQPRLTTDPGYNATLGAAYLAEQIGRFDGSYILTFIGYNAGPRRATEWVERYGDPRGKDIDTVVDWVERIPFTETRNYVQRVMENYQVYKMRLTGNADIRKDLVSGR